MVASGWNVSPNSLSRNALRKFIIVETTNLEPHHWHQWALPSHGLKIEAIDAHVCGQPLRLVLGGYPLPRGVTMIDKCRYSIKHLDHLRGSILLEPRGHPDMYACLLTPPQRVDSNFGTLFLHRSGICPMSAHGIVAAATICVEAGIVEVKAPETLLRFDTPAGRIRAYARVEENRVRRVFFENVPSYVVGQNLRALVPNIGHITYDLAYGGEFYAFVDAASVGLEITPERITDITQMGVAIAAVVEDAAKIVHHSEPLLSLLSGVVFTQELAKRRDSVAQARQVCVFTDGAVDRSPSGTALSGRLALMHARGEIDLGEAYIVEGLMGGTFTGRPARAGLAVGPYSAIVAEIEGSASITGHHSFFIDPADSLREGFLL